jgi:hypothetical protein
LLPHDVFVVAFETDQSAALCIQAGHKSLDDLPTIGAAIYVVAKCDQRGGELGMVRDFGKRHFEKIEAAVQISYGVSLAHCFHDGRAPNPA